MRGFFVSWPVFQVLTDTLVQGGVEKVLPAVYVIYPAVPQKFQKPAAPVALGKIAHSRHSGVFLISGLYTLVRSAMPLRRLPTVNTEGILRYKLHGGAPGGVEDEMPRFVRGGEYFQIG